MKIQHLGIAEAYASLNGGPSGLDDAEAERRLMEFGRNQVEEIVREPLLLTFAKGFAHFFAIILWVAVGHRGFRHHHAAAGGVDFHHAVRNRHDRPGGAPQTGLPRHSTLRSSKIRPPGRSRALNGAGRFLSNQMHERNHPK